MSRQPVKFRPLAKMRQYNIMIDVIMFKKLKRYSLDIPNICRLALIRAIEDHEERHPDLEKVEPKNRRGGIKGRIRRVNVSHIVDAYLNSKKNT